MNYDAYLLNQADEYYSECVPSVIGVDYEWEDGANVPYPICSCSECDNCECEYWEEYNLK